MSNKVPDFLIKFINEQYGINVSNKIINNYNTNRKVSFRVNTLKTNRFNIEKILNDNLIKYEKVDFFEDAFVVENASEKKLRELPIYNNGEIYFQSLSSMLPPIILSPKENEDILDMTAAPGGKTTQIAALTNNKSHITACEMNKIRFDRLKYNIEKQGVKCAYLMNKDARDIDDFFSFDKILLDAPCSGSGTINSNDENLNRFFTEKLIEKSIRSQEKLIKKAVKLLKKGGELVYSTCSILKQENENIINEILKDSNFEIIPIDIDRLNKLPLLPVAIKGTVSIMPTQYYEGFYVAKIRKK